MISIDFYDQKMIEEKKIKFAVITAFYNGQLIVVRHKERTSWEIPGGHKEEFETSEETAKRELFEETGAKIFELDWVCTYSVNRKGKKSYGQLYYAEIKEIGKLPESEIEEIKLVDVLPGNLTYPLIQPYLFKKVKKYIERVNGRT